MLQALVGAVAAVVVAVAHVGLEHAAPVVAAVVVVGARDRAARGRLVRQVLAVGRAYTNDNLLVYTCLGLGQVVFFQARQNKEVARSTENTWKNYWAMKDLMKGDLPFLLKRRLVDYAYCMHTLHLSLQFSNLAFDLSPKLEVCSCAM